METESTINEKQLKQEKFTEKEIYLPNPEVLLKYMKMFEDQKKILLDRMNDPENLSDEEEKKLCQDISAKQRKNLALKQDELKKVSTNESNSMSPQIQETLHILDLMEKTKTTKKNSPKK